MLEAFTGLDGFIVDGRFEFVGLELLSGLEEVTGGLGCEEGLEVGDIDVLGRDGVVELHAAVRIKVQRRAVWFIFTWFYSGTFK